MKRTTILAPDELLLELKYLAKQQGKTVTIVVQEALADYVAARRSPRKLSFIGIGDSGQTDVSERFDELLRANTNRRRGWGETVTSDVQDRELGPPEPTR